MTQSDREPEASPWWRGAVLYQIYPRSFADTDGNGVGDLNGIIAHLDHVASLGVDGVWLSPVFPSPMKDFGYDVSDYCGVDPLFGSLDDLDRLISRAHDLGLKVILDLVFAHTSERHPWFEASRIDAANTKSDWYVWADAKPDGTPPSNWQSVFGGPAWTWDARRGQYYMHNFLPEQPQLNLHNKAVQDALLEVVRFWLERSVDGFRLDAINFALHDPALTDNPPAPNGPRTRPFDFQQHLHNQSQPGIAAFLARIRALTDLYTQRFTVAEVVGPDAEPEMQAFTAGQRHLNSAYGFIYLYAPALTPQLVRQTQALWSGAPDQGWPSWAFSNHDAPRAASRWAEGRDPAAMAAVVMLLLLSLRGNAFLYQGEELGLPQGVVPFDRLRDPEAIANWPHTLGRDGARTPMPWSSKAPHAGFSSVEPWLPVDPRHFDLAVDRQEAAPSSMLHLTRDLIALRRALPVLRDGEMRVIDTPAPILAFERRDTDDVVLCVFNLGHDVAEHGLDGRFHILKAVNTDPALRRGMAPLEGMVLRRMAE